jgi:ubiquinone/menaquinone biosynthesis C-methylase UbiE
MASAGRPIWNTQEVINEFARFATPQHPLIGYDRVMRYHADDFRPYISLANGCTSPNMRILDMGCGTGFLSYAIAKVMHASSSVIGLDCSQGLLNRASQKKSTEAPNVSVEFKCADITNPQSL